MPEGVSHVVGAAHVKVYAVADADGKYLYLLCRKRAVFALRRYGKQPVVAFHIADFAGNALYGYRYLLLAGGKCDGDLGGIVVVGVAAIGAVKAAHVCTVGQGEVFCRKLRIRIAERKPFGKGDVGKRFAQAEHHFARHGVLQCLLQLFVGVGAFCYVHGKFLLRTDVVGRFLDVRRYLPLTGGGKHAVFVLHRAEQRRCAADGDGLPVPDVLRVDVGNVYFVVSCLGNFHAVHRVCDLVVVVAVHPNGHFVAARVGKLRHGCAAVIPNGELVVAQRRYRNGRALCTARVDVALSFRLRQGELRLADGERYRYFRRQVVCRCRAGYLYLFAVAFRHGDEGKGLYRQLCAIFAAAPRDAVSVEILPFAGVGELRCLFGHVNFRRCLLHRNGEAACLRFVAGCRHAIVHRVLSCVSKLGHRFGKLGKGSVLFDGVGYGKPLNLVGVLHRYAVRIGFAGVHHRKLRGQRYDKVRRSQREGDIVGKPEVCRHVLARFGDGNGIAVLPREIVVEGSFVRRLVHAFVGIGKIEGAFEGENAELFGHGVGKACVRRTLHIGGDGEGGFLHGKLVLLHLHVVVVVVKARDGGGIAPRRKQLALLVAVVGLAVLQYLHGKVSQRLLRVLEGKFANRKADGGILPEGDVLRRNRYRDLLFAYLEGGLRIVEVVVVCRKTACRDGVVSHGKHALSIVFTILLVGVDNAAVQHAVVFAVGKARHVVADGGILPVGYVLRRDGDLERRFGYGKLCARHLRVVVFVDIFVGNCCRDGVTAHGKLAVEGKVEAYFVCVLCDEAAVRKGDLGLFAVGDVIGGKGDVCGALCHLEGGLRIVEVVVVCRKTACRDGVVSHGKHALSIVFTILLVGVDNAAAQHAFVLAIHKARNAVIYVCLFAVGDVIGGNGHL